MRRSNRLNLFFRKMIISEIFLFFFSTFICLGILELFCFFYVVNFSDPLQRALRILRADSELGWRQSPNLNQTPFEGGLVTTDKNGFRTSNSAKFESVVLGPSSAFGWGVNDDKTYAHLLGATNWSQIGHTIVQGKKLFLKFPFESKKVILAFGVNELDRFRFFGTDLRGDIEYFKSAQQPSVIQSNLNLVSVFSRIFTEFYFLWPCPPNTVPQKRVLLENWSETLGEFVQVLLDRKNEVFILTTPSHYKLEKNPQLAKENQELYEESAVQAQKGSCSKARELFRKSKSLEVYRVIEEIQKLNDLTIEAPARWLSSFPERFALSQNEQVRKVKIIKIHDLLNESTDFVDPIHPSNKGHEKIANKVRASIN